jgi:rod shape-determining protein MreD
MLRFLVYTFLFFVAAILQTVVVPRIGIYGAQPSFLLILTIMAALRHGSLTGCILGFMSGLFCDVYAPVEWLGAYSLSFCIVGFTIGQINESFINLNLLLKAVVLLLADFLKDIIYYFSIGKAIDEVSQAMFFISAPNAIYTVIIGTVCFYFLSPKRTQKVEIYK